MRYDPHSGENTEYFTDTSNTNGLCFDVQGNLYGCQSGGRRIVRFKRDRSTISSLPRRLDGHQHNNPNDLAVDKQGRIWFTDPSTAPRATRNWTTCRSYASTPWATEAGS